MNEYETKLYSLQKIQMPAQICISSSLKKKKLMFLFKIL